MQIAVRDAVPADAAAIARVHVDTWRTAYAGILPDAFLAGLAYAASESNWSQAFTANRPDTCMVVAETAAGEVVGFAFGAPEREGNPVYRGEVFAIYVLAAYQRKGVGQRLLAGAARRLRAAGMASMLLWVLRDNHAARRFYAALGGEFVAEKAITIGGTDLMEVAYGWRDTTALAFEHDTCA